MASIIQRSRKSTGKQEKYYCIKYIDSAGAQKWVRGYTDKGETQALARRLELEARQVRVGDIDPSLVAQKVERTKPIEVQVNDYESSLRAAARTDGHIAYTIADINNLIVFAGDTGTPLASASGVTKGLVDRWVLSMRDKQRKGEKGFANKTINRKVASIQQWLKVLSSSGGVPYLLRGYPKLPTGTKYKVRNTRPLCGQELIKLIEAPHLPQHRKDLYIFASLTGLRLGECRQIEVLHCNTKQQTILVDEHISKNKKQQVIPMSKRLVPIINRISGDAGNLLKVATQTPTNRTLRRDCKRVGIEVEGISFHSFRHGFCTSLAQANIHPALLQKLARHADLRTTLNYYIHLQRTDEQEAIDRL